MSAFGGLLQMSKPRFQILRHADPSRGKHGEEIRRFGASRLGLLPEAPEDFAQVSSASGRLLAPCRQFLR